MFPQLPQLASNNAADALLFSFHHFSFADSPLPFSGTDAPGDADPYIAPRMPLYVFFMPFLLLLFNISAVMQLSILPKAFNALESRETFSILFIWWAYSLWEGRCLKNAMLKAPWKQTYAKVFNSARALKLPRKVTLARDRWEYNSIDWWNKGRWNFRSCRNQSMKWDLKSCFRKSFFTSGKETRI